jgi:hypothetical protein
MNHCAPDSREVAPDPVRVQIIGGELGARHLIERQPGEGALQLRQEFGAGADSWNPSAHREEDTAEVSMILN